MSCTAALISNTSHIALLVLFEQIFSIILMRDQHKKYKNQRTQQFIRYDFFIIMEYSQLCAYFRVLSNLKQIFGVKKPKVTPNPEFPSFASICPQSAQMPKNGKIGAATRNN